MTYYYCTIDDDYYYYYYYYYYDCYYYYYYYYFKNGFLKVGNLFLKNDLKSLLSFRKSVMSDDTKDNISLSSIVSFTKSLIF
jgi:hypothetical protein